MGRSREETFFLTEQEETVELHIELPGVERSVGEELVAIADSICPYSNTTRGNIPVKLILEKPSPTSESQAGMEAAETIKSQTIMAWTG